MPLTVAEHPDSLRARFTQLKLGLDTLEGQFNTGAAEAEEIRTRSITTQAEAVAAIRNLAALQREHLERSATMVRGVRRMLLDLLDLVVRRTR